MVVTFTMSVMGVMVAFGVVVIIVMGVMVAIGVVVIIVMGVMVALGVVVIIVMVSTQSHSWQYKIGSLEALSTRYNNVNQITS